MTCRIKVMQDFVHQQSGDWQVFETLVSIVTADHSQLRAVCEGPGWGQKVRNMVFFKFQIVSIVSN